MGTNRSVTKVADYMLKGFWGSKGAADYNFEIADGGKITVDLSGLDAAGKRLARWAMDSWEGVVDIDFVEVRRGAEVSFTDNGSGALTTYRFAGSDIVGATLNVPAHYVSNHGGAMDQFAFQTYLHEIGHLFGLGHPGPYDGGASWSQAIFASDSWQTTVMSYFDQTENPHVHDTKAVVMTPMAADIAALQKLYGAPKVDPTAGDTVWGVGTTLKTAMGDFFRSWEKGGAAHSNEAFSFLLRDAGGNDTIDFSHENRPQIARLDSAIDIINPVSKAQHAHILIDKGTMIENYLSGNGADRIVGNGRDNRISTGSNSDLIRGRGGDDVLDGGDGQDRLYGNGGGDRLIGGAAADKLYGAGGKDVLDGGEGLDQLLGGRGSDRLYGGIAADQLAGGGGADRLFGGDGGDRLSGGAGNDLLDGGATGDVLQGGAGRDRFVFDTGSGTDRILDFALGKDRLLLDADLLVGTDLATVLSKPRDLDGETMLRFDSGDRLVLHGLDASDLSKLADDILLT